MMPRMDDEDGRDLAAQADYYQALADTQDGKRTADKLKQRISQLESENAALKAVLAEVKGTADVIGERDALRARLERADELLKRLSNEASGFLSMADPDDHGITNIRVLQDKIDEARRYFEESHERTD